MNETEGLQFLTEALIFGGPEAYERQEAGRAVTFAASKTLPTKLDTSNWEVDPNERAGLARETLEKWGVKFLGLVEGDPSLQHVELPAGWKKVTTYEPRLVMLVDDQDKERARICLFSENKVLIIQPRYGIREMPLKELLYGNGAISVVVTDGRIVTGEGEVLYETEPTQPISGKEKAGRLGRARAWLQASDRAKAWLDENYPDWRDPLAYWD